MSSSKPELPVVVPRALALILDSLRARASYTTRVWTVLLLPFGAGTIFGWSTRMKLESLVLSVLIVIVYSIAHWWWRKYLR